VLILDEPTASLDPVSERTVIDGYEAVMCNRTTIVITHRLDVASRADRVLVLDGSRLVERGSPAELALSDSRYATLFQTQHAHAH
jgi:ATP-binding cassette subfamily B protein